MKTNISRVWKQPESKRLRAFQKARYILLLIIFISLLGIYNESMAQNGPPHPPQNHGSSNNQPAANGAPVGDAMILMFFLAGAYGGAKSFILKRNQNTNED